jgi:hypothetical protein
MPRPTLSPTRAKSTVSRCFLQVTKIGGTLADSDTRREPGRLLSAMLTPQCCALVIAPARKDRVDNLGARAAGVIAYSTRGGTSANILQRSPSASSSRSCVVSVCWVMPGIARLRHIGVRNALHASLIGSSPLLQHNLPLAEVARLIQSTSLIQRTILGQYSSSVRLPMNRPR